MAFRIETVTVTPAFARELLGRNVENNRSIRPNKVDQYARDMATGHWPMTGETVKISMEGRLLDGQHRMSAVIQADVPVTMAVAYDVDPTVMPVLDSGVSRGFADVLKIHGSPERILMGAVVRRVLQWEDGNFVAASGRVAPTPTNTEMLLRYEKDISGFAAATQRGCDVRRQRLGQGGPAGTAFYLFAGIDKERAHQFFDAYIGGANLNEGDPILTLRNRMVRSARDERLKGHETLALFVRAWNAWREERMLAMVPVTTGGRKLSNSNFPIPK